MIEVFVGPMYSMDLKKLIMALTVEIRAMPKVGSQALSLNEKSKPPEKVPNINEPKAEKRAM